MSTPEQTMEEKFAPKLPDSIRSQVEDVEKKWNEEREPEEEVKEPEPEPKPEEAREEEPPRAEELVPKKQFEDVQSQLREVQHQFSVLKGKYDAEKGPDLREKLNQAQGQINLLNEQLRLLQEKKPEQKRTFSLRDNPKWKKFGTELSPEGYENMISAMEETVGDLTSSYEEKINTLEGKLTKTIGMTREEVQAKETRDFWKSVMDKIPDYETLRVNSKFDEFFTVEEGMSGRPRGTFLSYAFQNLDATQVIKYFEAFRKSLNPEPLKSRPNPDKLKQRLGAPVGTGTAQRSSGVEGKVTVADIEQAGKDMERISEEFNRGAWKGREKQYEKEYARLWGIVSSAPSG